VRAHAHDEGKLTPLIHLTHFSKKTKGTKNMTTAITAYPKVTGRFQPVLQACVRPALETRSTLAALCPACSRETCVGLGAYATVYGSCQHLREIHETAGAISIVFEMVAS
jgi:hypothetical protein